MDSASESRRETSESMFLPLDSPPAENAAPQAEVGAVEDNGPERGSSEAPIMVEDDEPEAEEGAANNNDSEPQGPESGSDDPEEEAEDDGRRNDDYQVEQSRVSSQQQDPEGACPNKQCANIQQMLLERIAELERQLAEKDAAHSVEIRELKRKLRKSPEPISESDKLIKDQRAQIDEQKKTIKEQKRDHLRKDNIIKQQGKDILKKSKRIEALIKRLGRKPGVKNLKTRIVSL